MKIKYVIAGAVKMEVKTADDLVTAVVATLCVCEAREIRIRSSQLAYNRRSHAKISAHYWQVLMLRGECCSRFKKRDAETVDLFNYEEIILRLNCYYTKTRRIIALSLI